MRKPEQSADTPIIGKSLENMGYIDSYGFDLLALKRNGVDAVDIRPTFSCRSKAAQAFVEFILI